MVHSSPSSSPKLAHSLGVETYDLNNSSAASTRSRQKPYVLECADVEQTNTYGRGRAQSQPQQTYSILQAAPDAQRTSYYPQNYTQVDSSGRYQQYYLPQPYVSKQNPPQYYPATPTSSTSTQPYQYEYYVIEEPAELVSQPEVIYNVTPQTYVAPQHYLVEPAQQVVPKEMPSSSANNKHEREPRQGKLNPESYYEQYQYYQKHYQRKSPSRSSGHRSASPPSQRFVQNETIILNDLKELRKKKEYEAAAAAALKSPANQERVRRIMEESRRLEAQMRRKLIESLLLYKFIFH